jgi:hypothetical protein
MYRLEAEERIEQLGISSYPYLKKEAAREIMNEYKMRTMEALEFLTDNGDNEGIHKLKKILGG